MNSVLVRCFGFMGDALYASSLAKKLKEVGYDRVVYLNGIPQVTGILQRNPFIDEVLTTYSPIINTCNIKVDETFNTEISIQQCMFVDPPAVQMQKDAGILNSSPEFEVYTNPDIDAVVQTQYKDEPYITIMEPTSWELKSYIFTREQYNAGVDVPQFGYGGKHRNIRNIIKSFSDTHKFIFVGADSNHPTLALPFSNGHRSLDLEASIIKYSKAFIGVEGGLANLAAGVGTRTILTSDFVHQLYGWNGVIRKIEEPKLGPRYYFPDVQHIDINPYLSDEEVGIEINKCINGDYSSVITGNIFMGTGDIRQWI